MDATPSPASILDLIWEKVIEQLDTPMIANTEIAEQVANPKGLDICVPE